MIDDTPETTLSVGERLRLRRVVLKRTQPAVARAAGVSKTYYCSIETSKKPPPPAPTLARILEALSFEQQYATEIMLQAALERGVQPTDVDLPTEAQETIDEIRLHAATLPPRFLRHLAVMIREAAGAKTGS